MSNSTPGPWSYDAAPHDDAEQPSAFCISGDGRYFADVHVLTSDPDTARAEADARLIAATVDLLAAVRVARDYLSSRRNEPMAAAALEVVESALSLAEGEA